MSQIGLWLFVRPTYSLVTKTFTLCLLDLVNGTEDFFTLLVLSLSHKIDRDVWAEFTINAEAIYIYIYSRTRL
jgi:hypothetical protein